MDALIMLGILGIIGIVVYGFVYAGYKMVKASMTRPQIPAPPVARIENATGAERVYAKSMRATSKATKIWRPVAFTVGVGLIAAPFVGLYGLVTLMRELSGSWTKGRVLRIKNRAQLAEPALGDGWAADGQVGELARGLSGAERKALGELWLLTARMEHASVAAFSQLSLHLAALGAPADLLEATHRAALEEIRHARACFAIARAITGERHTAGPIAALGAARDGAIDLTRLAVGSLVDGCLAEGIAADVAARGAARATEPVIHQALAMIAHDEAGHAELAWDVLAWCLAHGDDAVRAAVVARIDVLDRELAPRLPDLPGVDDAALARYGVIGQDVLGALATARVAAVQARARAIVGSVPVLARAA
jgi:hypothetical protein